MTKDFNRHLHGRGWEKILGEKGKQGPFIVTDANAFSIVDFLLSVEQVIFNYVIGEIRSGVHFHLFKNARPVGADCFRT